VQSRSLRFLNVITSRIGRLRHTIDTIKRKTQTLIDASEEIGLEVNIEKTKYMPLSRHQNVGQNHDIKIGLKMCSSSDI
jgi:hypothetical protein